jgi:hypothetical protein
MTKETFAVFGIKKFAFNISNLQNAAAVSGLTQAIRSAKVRQS